MKNRVCKAQGQVSNSCTTQEKTQEMEFEGGLKARDAACQESAGPVSFKRNNSPREVHTDIGHVQYITFSA